MDRSQKRILMAKVIGEYIVSLRRDKGIAQKKLALFSGVPERTLRRIEKG